MNKTLTSAALLLALSACSCSRAVEQAHPEQKTSPARTRYLKPDKVGFDATGATQAARLRWLRPGTWTAARTIGLPPRNAVLVSRDQFGTRLIAMRPGSGYDLQIVDLDCARKRVHVAEARTSTSDIADPDIAKPVPLMVAPLAGGEIDRICGIKPTAGRDTVKAAATTLRHSAPGTKPPAPNAENSRLTADYDKQQAADAAAIANAKKTGRPVVIHDKMP